MKKNIRKRLNIPFSKESGTEFLADLYLPEEEPGVEYPVLLLIHGGAWQAGSKEMYKEWGPYLAERGFAALSIDYRLSAPEQASWPGVLGDVQAAYNWLTEKATELQIDRHRIGIIGDSAGAHLALNLALQEQALGQIKVIIPVYGVLELAEWREHSLQIRTDDPVFKLLGATPIEAPEVYKAASPIYHLEKLKTNKSTNGVHVLVIWGEADEVVPATHSKRLVQALQELKIPTETIAVADAGHFWFTIFPGIPGGGMADEPNPTVAPQVIDFLNRYL